MPRSVEKRPVRLSLKIDDTPNAIGCILRENIGDVPTAFSLRYSQREYKIFSKRIPDTPRDSLKEEIEHILKESVEVFSEII